MFLNRLLPMLYGLLPMGGEVEEQTEIVLQKERNAFVPKYYHFTHLHMPKTYSFVKMRTFGARRVKFWE